MSNFQCEKCGTVLIDTPGNGYVTECEHYPKKYRDLTDAEKEVMVLKAVRASNQDQKKVSIKSAIREKHGIALTNMPKTSKNYVSYFYAGYKAGLVVSGNYTPEQIEELDYTTTSFKTDSLPLYQTYLDGEYDDDGLENMYAELKTFKPEIPTCEKPMAEKVAEQTQTFREISDDYDNAMYPFRKALQDHDKKEYGTQIDMAMNVIKDWQKTGLIDWEEYKLLSKYKYNPVDISLLYQDGGGNALKYPESEYELDPEKVIDFIQSLLLRQAEKTRRETIDECIAKIDIRYMPVNYEQEIEQDARKAIIEELKSLKSNKDEC